MKYLIFNEQDGVGTLTFNNPAALNALNTDMLQEMREFLTDPAQQASLRALILTGEGKAFIAGADIKEMSAMTPSQAKTFSMLGNSVMNLIQHYPVPVIAAVNGFALGGGLEVALSADFMYASAKAKFGLPEVTLGLIPGFGGTKRLTQRVGTAMTRELVYTGKMITADEALRIGLANQVAVPEELMAAVTATAQAIAQVSPHAVREAKELLNQCPDENAWAVATMEYNKFGLIFSHPQSKEGIAAFIEKRKADWPAE
ncbi:MAG: enoyl-CoA hydratase/isomerase family protein [Acidobacteria bacterium]|nr:enoyl-CoA hydratase/isomerase family protein [Acidobacteriota bacterium]